MHKHVERKTKSSQCDHMVWWGLPTPPHRKCPFTAYSSVVRHHILSPSSNVKPARLSPVVALKLNQAERRHSSPYHAISISMRSSRAHATLK